MAGARDVEGRVVVGTRYGHGGLRIWGESLSHDNVRCSAMWHSAGRLSKRKQTLRRTLTPTI
jgi:hypothetical protein